MTKFNSDGLVRAFSSQSLASGSIQLRCDPRRSAVIAAGTSRSIVTAGSAFSLFIAVPAVRAASSAALPPRSRRRTFRTRRRYGSSFRSCLSVSHQRKRAPYVRRKPSQRATNADRRDGPGFIAQLVSDGLGSDFERPSEIFDVEQGLFHMASCDVRICRYVSLHKLTSPDSTCNANASHVW